ncbi:UDP-N-acetylmuramate--L-alanine ligase [Oceanithermus sp.]
MKHVHFMGIGGVGISALAYVLHKEGWRVSGCDAGGGRLVERLRRQGIAVFDGHDPAHLENVDVLVASNAIPEDNPELRAAALRGVERRERMLVLADILGRGRSIGVSGTHGKTTTTAMIAHIFQELGDDPLVLVGADFAAIGGNVRWGLGRRIAEVDESDPLISAVAVDLAVLTNLEDDHVAVTPDERKTYHASYEALEEAVAGFAARAGRVLYNADWDSLRRLTDGLERVGYGFGGGRYRAVEAGEDGFTFAIDGRPAARVRLAVPGRHNVENAVAALAVAHLEGLDPREAARALATFVGTARRFEELGRLRGALIVDDYAHHPTEVAATLAAARQLGRRVRVVFQPHRYGRTRQMWRRFAEALRAADEVLVLEVYPAGEAPLAGVSGRLIAERLAELGHGAARFAGWDEARAYLQDDLGENDLLLTMGAGDVRRLGLELLEES